MRQYVNFRDRNILGRYDDAPMGILMLLTGLFIIMGGVQMIGLGIFALTIIGIFVSSSMFIGKAVFRL
jgi:hypothetical protein